MTGLWSRLFGRGSAAPGDAPATRRVPATAPPSTRAAAAPAGDATGLTGAQRPLVSANGRIAGFEFRLPTRPARTQASARARLAPISGLLAAMRLSTQDGRVALCELPAARLATAPLDALAPRMLFALVGDLPADADPAALRAAWKARGVAIGWRDDSPPPALAGTRPDFLVLPEAHDPVELLKALRLARTRHPKVPLVALDVPDLGAMEAVLAAGIAYAAGRLEGDRTPQPGGALPPQARPLLQLLARLAADADTAEVVATVKSDVALSTRLLARINAAAMASTQTLGSIEQAVALLGRNALYGSVSQLLVLTAPPSLAMQALQSMTLARARLFERLAQQRGEPVPGALFTLGLASMLPALLRAPMADVLTAMPLHPQARLALESRGGPWADWLSLAEHLDTGDLASAADLVERFGGMAVVAAAMAEGWLFAVQGQSTH
ncbi:HDOD domain-containing protein [Rubrivivax albus]|uniref:HDOD domain-containing protein n=1 Tax=Rubrivivax albus TaxID=2499835 RepID=A0A3S2U291_9BURK|nr:HDOD domain-containing protein [Rubrivivax albus]